MVSVLESCIRFISIWKNRNSNFNQSYGICGMSMMILRRISLVLSLPLLLCCKDGGGADPSGDIGESPPNIIFIFTDDQTYETIQALGFDELRTPNLNRMVESGTTFTHAYNMGGWNGAVCIASRSMMLSDLSIWNARKQDSLWAKEDSLAISASWPRLLENRGYKTHMTEKWHVTLPVQKVFGIVRNVRPGMPGDRRNELPAAEKKWRQNLGQLADLSQYLPLGYCRTTDENDT